MRGRTQSRASTCAHQHFWGILLLVLVETVVLIVLSSILTTYEARLFPPLHTAGGCPLTVITSSWLMVWKKKEWNSGHSALNWASGWKQRAQVIGVGSKKKDVTSKEEKGGGEGRGEE